MAKADVYWPDEPRSLKRYATGVLSHRRPLKAVERGHALISREQLKSLPRIRLRDAERTQG